MKYPKKIIHWINNKEVDPSINRFFPKINPSTGKVIAQCAVGNSKDVNQAVLNAQNSLSLWSATSVIHRSEVIRNATIVLNEKKEEIAEIIHLETGKSKQDAESEILGAVELGFFMSGEGRRYYGKTTTSSIENRWAYTIRQPVGVCALIIPFNTPIANVAWKTFPALLCGNTCVVKAASDTPYTPIWFGKLLKEAGLPAGVYNVIQGTGQDVGDALLTDERINLVSFTGSVEVGKYIQRKTADRLLKVSLELGGKNPFIVCDDADISDAVNLALLSAFSNAGQRCSSGSRILVFNSVYDQFKSLFLEKAKAFNPGPTINEKQLARILFILEKSIKSKKVKLLLGGKRLADSSHKKGYFLEPTVLESIQHSEYDNEEVFGPITCLYKIKNLEEAIDLTNNSSYGLTAAIHTSNINRAQYYVDRARVGVVSVNGATYGSEPHMPFGGLRNSGNGHREPGSEALDVYSEWKTVYLTSDPNKI